MSCNLKWRCATALCWKTKSHCLSSAGCLVFPFLPIGMKVQCRFGTSNLWFYKMFDPALLITLQISCCLNWDIAAAMRAHKKTKDNKSEHSTAVCCTQTEVWPCALTMKYTAPNQTYWPVAPIHPKWMSYTPRHTCVWLSESGGRVSNCSI